MTDPNTPADPNQPPPADGYGQPTPGAPGQPGPEAYAPPPQGAYPPPGQSGAYPPPGGYQAPGQPGQPGPYPPAGGYQQAPVSESDERTWAMLGHLGGILIGFIAGLIVYLVYKDRSQYLKEQGAEALNFQITMAIGWLAGLVLTAVFIGALIIPVVAVLQLVFGIIAGLAANKHENYRYPFAIRIVK